MQENKSVLSFESDSALVQLLNGIPKVDILACLQKASQTGKGIATVVREIWEVSRGPGSLHPNEYFYYGLYKDDLSAKDKLRFVGKTVQDKLHFQCNDVQWKAVADNKHLFYAAMKGHGFPVPETIAVQSAAKVLWPGRTLHSREELIRFLRESEQFPLFAKPIDGIFSIGTFGITSVDAEDDKLVLASGEQVRIEQFVDYVLGITKSGYLFQRTLAPHAQLKDAFGTVLSTVRFLVVLSEQGAEIVSAVCKIPAHGNMADNFWRQGNMLGAVTPDTGELSRVVSGTGFDQKEHLEHPDTKRPIRGMVLPDWEKAKALCLEAAATLPGIRTQSWDIALTEEGPAIIETNWGGDLNLHQLAHRRGILQDSYLDHLRRCGCKIRLPAIRP